MREMAEQISAAECKELISTIEQLYGSVPAKRQVTAADFMMDEMEPDRIVVREIELKWDGNRLRVGASLPDARPPFEWIYEISSDVGESDYFKHYLVRTDDIVLTERKLLVPIDAAEAEVLRADLQAGLESLTA
jgi:hypothetical protein